jgi:hypothetical protein
MTLPESSVFDAIYDSPWHHPLLCWAATPLLLWGLWRARPTQGAAALTLWRLALLALLLLAVDALFTGAWSPLVPDSRVSGAVGLLFVVLGDLRYFVLVERFAPPVAPRMGSPPRFGSRALALSLLVPWLCAMMGAAAPVLLTEPRWKFVIYELAFLLLLAWVRWVRLPRRLAGLPPGTAALQQWLLRRTGFEAAQYALWVIADVVILAGVPAGLLLRLVPNVLYYVVFIPLAYFTAPPELRRSPRSA